MYCSILFEQIFLVSFPFSLLSSVEEGKWVPGMLTSQILLEVFFLLFDFPPPLPPPGSFGTSARQGPKRYIHVISDEALLSLSPSFFFLHREQRNARRFFHQPGSFHLTLSSAHGDGLAAVKDTLHKSFPLFFSELFSPFTSLPVPGIAAENSRNLARNTCPAAPFFPSFSISLCD